MKIIKTIGILCICFISNIAFSQNQQTTNAQKKIVVSVLNAVAQNNLSVAKSNMATMAYNQAQLEAITVQMKQFNNGTNQTFLIKNQNGNSEFNVFKSEFKNNNKVVYQIEWYFLKDGSNNLIEKIMVPAISSSNNNKKSIPIAPGMN
jgi:uncharacterized membrane-anchored protein